MHSTYLAPARPALLEKPRMYTAPLRCILAKILIALPALCVAATAGADTKSDLADITRQAVLVIDRQDGPITAFIAPPMQVLT